MQEQILQRTPEWFAKRVGKVTASRAGAILGLAPYQSRAAVLRAMVREALGAQEEMGDNPALAYGAYNEAGAFIEFQMESGLKCKPAPFLIYEDWLGASPDGYTSDGGLVEIKCPFGKRKEENPVFLPIEEQPHYYAQMQVQMHVARQPHCWFYQWAVNFAKAEKVLYDPDWINENLPALKQFHAEFLDELANNAEEHLAPKRVTIDTIEARKMVEEWDDLNERLEQIAERKKDLLADMVKLSGEKNADLAGRKLTLTKREGAISYAKAVKELAPKADLNKWRGKPSEFWSLK